MTVADRLKELGITLPTRIAPAGVYLPAVETGKLCYVSGHVNTDDTGTFTSKGKVGAEVSIQQGHAAARQATLNGLNGARSVIGSLDRVARVVRVTGYVNSAPGFDQHPKVINGASEILRDIFGEDGVGARSAIGVAELPFGAPVEVELILELRD